MAKLSAIINFKENSLTLQDEKIKFLKNFPRKRTFNHTVSFSNTSNGDWLVPDFQKLKNLVIAPGLYNASKFKTTVNIVSKSPDPPKLLPKLGLHVNNFETLQPIPISGKSEINIESIHNLTRTNHIASCEKVTNSIRNPTTFHSEFNYL
jgi:hypothetical protein